MSTHPFELKRQVFLKALSQLESALNEPYSDYIRDACIQRFEFTYELAWKTLKRYLATLDLETRNAKETLKEAYTQGLISDADKWSHLHQQRNLTSHTYDEALAKGVYDYLQQEGLALFQELQQTLSGLTV